MADNHYLSETRCITCGKVLTLEGKTRGVKHYSSEISFPIPDEMRVSHASYGLLWAHCTACEQAIQDAADVVCKHAFANGYEQCNQSNLHCSAPDCLVPRKLLEAQVED